ncbi:MAG: hypothetical protein HY738_16375 [Bacteroidia bacterium]|nr:hypothetical protein [Bacteroidia bacterium]
MKFIDSCLNKTGGAIIVKVINEYPCPEFLHFLLDIHEDCKYAEMPCFWSYDFFTALINYKNDTTIKILNEAIKINKRIEEDPDRFIYYAIANKPDKYFEKIMKNIVLTFEEKILLQKKE